jgi:hypothetical protein
VGTPLPENIDGLSRAKLKLLLVKLLSADPPDLAPYREIGVLIEMTMPHSAESHAML